MSAEMKKAQVCLSLFFFKIFLFLFSLLSLWCRLHRIIFVADTAFMFSAPRGGASQQRQSKETKQRAKSGKRTQKNGRKKERRRLMVADGPLFPFSSGPDS
ncbi:hypothetical protein TW95_gp1229 [Pandoravirus inopinatum]|uniref:Uncharacterized protein n=1 Tax=Pandoravirus inopinatum TaxID=1605721 RepID=A0A0B5IYK1_9VIRU|nr:hypothetical protein TW95_gp1229 [Pandoravirus inopinatum]AJF97963.1 hypothetical protein [Pandoravirus inopinatum]